MEDEYILTLSCADRPGIVAAVAGLLAQTESNITEAEQFEDHRTGLFFMRVVFQAREPLERLRQHFAPVAARYGMSWEMRSTAKRHRVLILVSKFDHCLNDLLYRNRIGELDMDVVGVVSNHPREALHAPSIDGIPFHHLPVSPETKRRQEALVEALIDRTGAELVVLARYMQILSDDFATALAGRCINIHHSFLPGFKGARPYHQAHARGVKIIGATAHYVTADLDEGPIIAQDVEHVSHRDRPEDLIRKGRAIEQRVLSRAVRHHLQGRVFIDGATTVVFPD